MSSFGGELRNVKASVLGLRNMKTHAMRNLEVKDITHSIIKSSLTAYESAGLSACLFGWTSSWRVESDDEVNECRYKLWQRCDHKNTHALRLMLPKASIKETTRTLTFNCFISTILVHNVCASSSGADPGIFDTYQPRMWKSPSDPELFPSVVSTGKCICRWPEVMQKTCTKRKDLNNRTHNERRQMWAHIDIHHQSNSQINPLNGTCGQWAVE